jgi:hypothetical protein
MKIKIIIATIITAAALSASALPVMQTNPLRVLQVTLTFNTPPSPATEQALAAVASAPGVVAAHYHNGDKTWTFTLNGGTYRDNVALNKAIADGGKLNFYMWVTFNGRPAY